MNLKEEKMLHLRLTLTIATTLLLATTSAFAGGIYLSEFGTPVSLGTAGAANVVNNESADAVYTNPAGMTGIKEDVLLSGLQILLPDVRFDSEIAEAGGSDGGNSANIAVIPSLFVVKKLPNDFTAGFAITGPLGGGVDYGKSFVGRYQANKSVLTGLGVTTSVGYKINDQWSVGAGVTAIYTTLDSDVSIKQAGGDDGNLNIDKIDDWSPQGFFSVNWQPTEKVLFGLLYRTSSSVELDGDLNITGITNPIIKEITDNLNDIQMDLDYAQLISVGVKYQATDNLVLVADFDWEDWSELGKEQIVIGTPGPSIVQYADFHWKDTYHVGAGAIYKLDDGGRFVSGGLGYDSSPVDDKYRTFILPIDEQFKVGFAYGKESPTNDQLSYSLGCSYTWFGDGKIDQTAQGVRAKGEFSTNYAVFLGATFRYVF
jgi:long-chain fatty acid transport protein